MKRLIVATVGLGAVIGLGFYVSQPKAPVVPPVETAVESAVESPPTPAIEPPRITKAVVAMPELPGPVDGNVSAPMSPAAVALRDINLVFKQALETLISPRTGYEQKQATWKLLKDTGKLDQAIAELEQSVASDPRSIESVTALGEAYYKKAGQTEDVRESAIFAMKADQTLEAALNLDPSNWAARFTKTVGMTYWPAELNKGKEVIEQFRILIQQQETQPTQPEFAHSYLRLGEQYRKAGFPDYAAQVWQRGAALFPNDDDLKDKLASTQSASAENRLQ